MPSSAAVGEAFATHNFSMAGLYLHEQVVWEVVGSAPLRGKVAVMAELAGLTDALVGTTVVFRYMQSYANEHAATVISVADYEDPAGARSSVASFDTLVFEEGLVSRITSYNVELPAGS